MKHTVFLSLGSNVGDKISYLENSLKLMTEYVDIELKSSWYETEAINTQDDSPFINGVVTGITLLSPFELLRATQETEKHLGRNEKGNLRPRTIDIDILFFDDMVILSDELIVPHKNMALRNFVLIPLNEIAPNFVHPVLHKSVQKLLKDSRDVHYVKKLT